MPIPNRNKITIPTKATISSAPRIIIVKAVAVERPNPKELKAKIWIASWLPKAVGIGIIAAK